MAIHRTLVAMVLPVFGLFAGVASAGDFQGVWVQGGGGADVTIGWSSDFGPPMSSGWGLPPYSGPYTGPRSCSVSRNFGTGHLLGGTGLIAASINATLPAAQGTPTTDPLHIVFNNTVQNGNGVYGMTAGGGVHIFAYVTGTTLYYRINWTATYTGIQNPNCQGGRVFLSHGSMPAILDATWVPGTSASGVVFGTSSETFDMTTSLYQGQNFAGHGNFVVVADVFFSDTPFAPAEPGLQSPTNGATNQPVQPKLIWTPGAGAATYTVKVADNPSLSNPLHTASGLTATSYTIPPSVLAGCSTYYWGVTAVNAAGATPSAPASFALTTAPTTGLTAALTDATPFTTCPAAPISATVQVAGDGTIAYQWQARLAGASWVDLAEGPNPWNNGMGGEFSAAGVHSPTATISGFADAPEDFPFPSAVEMRCIASNACTSQTSDTLVAQVCPSDFNCDGFSDAIDYDEFINAWLVSDPSSDLNLDEFSDAIDYDFFVTAWLAGC